MDGRNMVLQRSVPQTALDSELCFSYFVRGRTKRPSRVGRAKVLDISEVGLCMEISPLDSDLFMDPDRTPPAVNRDIGLQIYCRSHSSNVFVEGSVIWFKQKGELDEAAGSSDSIDICAGVVFSIDDAEKKHEIRQILGCLKIPTTRCRSCGAPVSVEASLCYKCGARPVGRREAFKAALGEALAHQDPDARV